MKKGVGSLISVHFCVLGTVQLLRCRRRPGDDGVGSMVETGFSPAWAVSGDSHCGVAGEVRQALPFAWLCLIQAREAIWFFLATIPLSP